MRFHRPYSPMLHRPRTLATLAIAATAVIYSRPVLAGCPNPCELTAGPATIEPALDCVSLEARPQSCDCSVSLTVGNGCAAAVQAADFVFDTCWSTNEDSSTFDHQCTLVEPGRMGTVELALDAVGNKAWTLQLRGDDGDHTVHVEANVTSLGNEGCGCVPSSLPGL